MDPRRQHDALQEWIRNEPGPLAEVPEPLLRKVLPASLEPVTPLPPTPVLAAQFTAVFLLFALAAIAVMGVDGLARMSLLQIAGMGAVVAAGLALLCVSLAWQMIPGSRRRLAAATAMSLPAGAFLLATLLLFPLRESDAFVASGLVCLRAGLLMAPAVSLLLWLLLRRGAILEPGPLAVSLGAIAGLTSATVLQFSCTHQDLGHLFTWHGAVLLASMTLGGIAARAALHSRHAIH